MGQKILSVKKSFFQEEQTFIQVKTFCVLKVIFPNQFRFDSFYWDLKTNFDFVTKDSIGNLPVVTLIEIAYTPKKNKCVVFSSLSRISI